MSSIQDAKPAQAAATAKLPESAHLPSRVDDIVIGLGVSTSGRFQTEGAVFVDGALEEADVASAVLSVSQGGRFSGVANVQRAEIAGEMNGEAYASDEIVLRSSAVVTGKLSAPYIVVHRGAAVSGDVKSVARTGDGHGVKARPAKRRNKKGFVLLLCAIAFAAGGAAFVFWN